jgi:hypothetical protein
MMFEPSKDPGLGPTAAHSLADYTEIPEKSRESTIGNVKYQTRVLKHNEVDLGGTRRFCEGFGLLILTAGTAGLALISNRVRNRWQEVCDGRSVKYIKTPLSSTDRRLSTSTTPLLRETSSEEQPVGKWVAQEHAALPSKQCAVAEAYWKMYISAKPPREDHSMLVGFLQGFQGAPSNLPELFEQAIKEEDIKQFTELFSHLPIEPLTMINNGENLNALHATLTDEPVKISPAFVKDANDFIRDTNFSGMAATSDGTSTCVVASEKALNLDTPFSIHSVGKAFTGALLLHLVELGAISEKSLNEPIQLHLDEDVVKALPPAVRDQLSKTKLREVMLHRGRYGGYFDKYVPAIEKALKEGSVMPRIHDPRDFLAYADEELVPLDKLRPDGSAYSNLGILLVGLAIEHLYNQTAKEKLPYSEILKRYVLEPAGIQMMETEMPKGARVNIKDETAPHMAGGPAGGYWSTARELLRFGDWLRGKSKESRFMELLELYGGEFYKNREIVHGGSLDSASAYFSYRIDNGLTIAVMELTGLDPHGQEKAEKLGKVLQEHLLEESYGSDT